MKEQKKTCKITSRPKANKFKGVEVPDLSNYDFPDDYAAFEDENLDMLP